MKSRFGDEKLLIEVYVRELLKLVLNNTVYNEENSVTSLYDKLETQLRGLESLGVTRDKYAAMLYPLVESALPEEVLKTWQRIRYQTTVANQQNNTDVDDQLSPLMKFLRSEVDSEIRLKLAKTGINIDDDSKDSVMRIQSQERKIICFFCKDSGHYKQDCQKYKRWLEKNGNKVKNNPNNDTHQQNSTNDQRDTSVAPTSI